MWFCSLGASSRGHIDRIHSFLCLGGPLMNTAHQDSTRHSCVSVKLPTLPQSISASKLDDERFAIGARLTSGIGSRIIFFYIVAIGAICSKDTFHIRLPVIATFYGEDGSYNWTSSRLTSSFKFQSIWPTGLRWNPAS